MSLTQDRPKNHPPKLRSVKEPVSWVTYRNECVCVFFGGEVTYGTRADSKTSASPASPSTGDFSLLPTRELPTGPAHSSALQQLSLLL